MASLRSEGLVVSRQGSGVFVADHRANPSFRIVSDEVRSLAEVQDVLQLRLAVEAEGGRHRGRAAQRRGPRADAAPPRGDRRLDRGRGSGDRRRLRLPPGHRVGDGHPQFERFMHFWDGHHPATVDPPAIRDAGAAAALPRAGAGGASPHPRGDRARNVEGRPLHLARNISRPAGSATAACSSVRRAARRPAATPPRSRSGPGPI